ncbi:MAG TPA: hypothetical protein VN372_09830 [Methanospirillum sp.]|nr:hypothetical protein [Methanospirillum sp.]
MNLCIMLLISLLHIPIISGADEPDVSVDSSNLDHETERDDNPVSPSNPPVQEEIEQDDVKNVESGGENSSDPPENADNALIIQKNIDDSDATPIVQNQNHPVSWSERSDPERAYRSDLSGSSPGWGWVYGGDTNEASEEIRAASDNWFFQIGEKKDEESSINHESRVLTNYFFYLTEDISSSAEQVILIYASGASLRGNNHQITASQGDGVVFRDGAGGTLSDISISAQQGDAIQIEGDAQEGITIGSDVTLNAPGNGYQVNLQNADNYQNDDRISLEEYVPLDEISISEDSENNYIQRSGKPSDPVSDTFSTSAETVTVKLSSQSAFESTSSDNAWWFFFDGTGGYDGPNRRVQLRASSVPALYNSYSLRFPGEYASEIFKTDNAPISGERPVYGAVSPFFHYANSRYMTRDAWSRDEWNVPSTSPLTLDAGRSEIFRVEGTADNYIGVTRPILTQNTDGTGNTVELDAVAMGLNFRPGNQLPEDPHGDTSVRYGSAGINFANIANYERGELQYSVTDPGTGNTLYRLETSAGATVDYTGPGDQMVDQIRRGEPSSPYNNRQMMYLPDESEEEIRGGFHETPLSDGGTGTVMIRLPTYLGTGRAPPLSSLEIYHVTGEGVRTLIFDGTTGNTIPGFFIGDVTYDEQNGDLTFSAAEWSYYVVRLKPDDDEGLPDSGGETGTQSQIVTSQKEEYTDEIDATLDGVILGLHPGETRTIWIRYLNDMTTPMLPTRATLQADNLDNLYFRVQCIAPTLEILPGTQSEIAIQVTALPQTPPGSYGLKFRLEQAGENSVSRIIQVQIQVI